MAFSDSLLLLMTITYTRKPTRLSGDTVLRVSNRELMVQLHAFMHELEPFAHDEMKTIADAMAVISNKQGA